MFNSTGNFKALGAYGNMYRNPSVASYAEAKQLQKFVDAIMEEDVKTMKKIIKKGIDVNLDLRFEGGLEKMTALHFSAMKGLVLATREILTAKCEINKETQFDLSTALHFACQVENLDAAMAITKDLLSHGANPNLLDHSGRTPLYVAVQGGTVEIVRLLIRYGADPSIACKEEEYPESIRRMSKQFDLMDRELEDLYDPYQGNTPLIQACREHFIDVVRELLKADCDINARNAAGNTALHVAAKSESRSTYLDSRKTRFPLSGSVVVVQLLVDAGCDLDLLNHQRDSPLKRAVDGIREIFSWSFSQEDRIHYCKMFCDVTSFLILSGCNVFKRYEDKTILTVLLEAATHVEQADCQSLANKYTICIMHMLAAGVPLAAGEDSIITGVTSTVTMLLEALEEAFERPPSLKHLCKLTLRRHMRLPMRKNINCLGLPKSLKSYVALESNK